MTFSSVPWSRGRTTCGSGAASLASLALAAPASEFGSGEADPPLPLPLLGGVLGSWCDDPHDASIAAGIIAAPITTDRATSFNGDRPWYIMARSYLPGGAGFNLALRELRSLKPRISRETPASQRRA
jgi:hypothetical protein